MFRLPADKIISIPGNRKVHSSESLEGKSVFPIVMAGEETETIGSVNENYKENSHIYTKK